MSEQGKTMRELRQIVDADMARWARLGQMWDYLTESEQNELIDAATKMVGAEFWSEVAQK